MDLWHLTVPQKGVKEVQGDMNGNADDKDSSSNTSEIILNNVKANSRDEIKVHDVTNGEPAGNW